MKETLSTVSRLLANASPGDRISALVFSPLFIHVQAHPSCGCDGRLLDRTLLVRFLLVKRHRHRGSKIRSESGQDNQRGMQSPLCVMNNRFHPSVFLHPSGEREPSRSGRAPFRLIYSEAPQDARENAAFPVEARRFSGRRTEFDTSASIVLSFQRKPRGRETRHRVIISCSMKPFPCAGALLKIDVTTL